MKKSKLSILSTLALSVCLSVPTAANASINQSKKIP